MSLLSCSSFVPHPVTPLHKVDAQVKQVGCALCCCHRPKNVTVSRAITCAPSQPPAQAKQHLAQQHPTHLTRLAAPPPPPACTQLWLLMLYVLIARATPLLRLGIAGVVAAFTVTCLPRRLWVSQFKRLGFICGLIFVFTALGADGVPPVLQQHSLPPALEGISAPLTPDTPYSYVVFNLFGWITITRRSINLAITASALTFCALQSASLCLVTTPGEEMALGLSRHVHSRTTHRHAALACYSLDDMPINDPLALGPSQTELPFLHCSHPSMQVAEPIEAAGCPHSAHRIDAAAVAALHVTGV